MDNQQFIEATIDLQSAFLGLSEYEQEILWLWGIGFTQNELDTEIGITQPGISQKLQAILEKLRGLL